VSEQAKQNLNNILDGAIQGLDGALQKCANSLDKTDAEGWSPRQVVAHVTFGGGAGVEPFFRQALADGKVEIHPGQVPDIPGLATMDLAALQSMVAGLKSNTQGLINGLSDEDLATSIETQFGTFQAEQLLGMLLGMHTQDHTSQLNAFAAS
jgi:hypothetical protein